MPATVEITVASRDTSRVVDTLWMMARSWNSSSYQRREKPCHTTLLLPALKEKMIISRMGAYRNRKTRAMNRRLPTRRCLFIAPPPVPRPHRSDS